MKNNDNTNITNINMNKEDKTMKEKKAKFDRLALRSKVTDFKVKHPKVVKGLKITAGALGLAGLSALAFKLGENNATSLIASAARQAALPDNSTADDEYDEMVDQTSNLDNVEDADFAEVEETEDVAEVETEVETETIEEN